MELEITDIVTKSSWEEHYSVIHRTCVLNNSFSSAVASKSENIPLNRYRDVYPYDHSRIVLENSNDYINASLVKVPRANRSYILAQGPLHSTVGHFWLMIWQKQSVAIIMLNRLVEKCQSKCYPYWPKDEGQVMEFDDVGFKLTHISSVSGQHYTIRKLLLTNSESEKCRHITHFHYTTWPDFGVPTCPDTFLEFLDAVRDSGSLNADVGPAIVHCSAGIGRSGTFCLVDTCLVLISQDGNADAVVVKDVLLEMRKCRMGLIQTSDQLRFSYSAIVAGAIKAGLMSPTILNIMRSDGEAPPPMPPRRTESLSSQHNNSSVASIDAVSTTHNGDDDGSPKVRINGNSFETEEANLRKRQKMAAKVALEAKIRDMKEKSRLAEENHSRIQDGSLLSYFTNLPSISIPFFVGITMFIIGGYIFITNKLR